MGDPAKQWAALPSPIRPGRQVTFEESSNPQDCRLATAHKGRWLPPSIMGSISHRLVTTQRGGPWGLPVLDPQVAEFLSGERPEDDPGSWECPPKPPLKMPRTGLHGEWSRLQCPHGGLNWQVSQAQRIPTSSHSRYRHPFRCHRHVITWWKDFQWLYDATSTTLSGLGCAPPAEGYEIWLAGLSLETTSKDFSICQGPTTLGWSSQTHTARQFMPVGRVHQGVDGVYEAICHIHQCWSIQPSRAPELDKSHPHPSPQKPLSLHPFGNAVRVGIAGLGQEAQDWWEAQNPPKAWDIHNWWPQPTQRALWPCQVLKWRFHQWVPELKCKHLFQDLWRLLIPSTRNRPYLRWWGPLWFVSRMTQDMWGMMTINMMTCQLNVLGLEPAPPSSTVIITEMLAEITALEDVSGSEDWRWL